MNEALRKWSRIIAGILAVAAILYFGLLVFLIYDYTQYFSIKPMQLILASFALTSAAAPFLALVGLARHSRPLYLVSAIWFLALTIFFGIVSLVTFYDTGPSDPPLFLLTVIPGFLCAALSYLQGRLYWGARGEEAKGVIA
jgi:hypothetical membrane protein